jgi:protein SCO1/2
VNDQKQKRARLIRRTLILALLVCLGIAIIAVSTFTKEEPLPRVIKELPAFELIDTQGRPYGTEQLRGHTWVASFIYSTCPGPCPMIVRKIRDLDQRLADLTDLRLVSISVDPENDSPVALAKYASEHRIPPGRWKLLTGDADAVFSLIRKGFLLTSGKARELLKDALSDEEMDEVLRNEGPVTHSERLVLVDRNGAIRGFYHANDPIDLDRLAVDAKRLDESYAKSAD